MTIVITAPTSTIGSLLVDDLLERDASVRLIVRDPSRLNPTVSDRAQVIEGSHREADVIDRACQGAAAMFWLTPSIPGAPTADDSFAGFARAACATLARHRVPRVVGISALGRGTPIADHAGLVTASLAMDDLIAASGVAYRAITCPSLMHNLLNHVDAISQHGRFSMTIDPDLRAPTVAATDVAATAARLLLDDKWDGSGEVPCLGPEDLSPNDMARIISDVLGTPVAYVQTSGEALRERLMGFGFSAAMATAMVEMFDAKNHGLDNAEPRTAASTTPTTFQQWCIDVLAPAVSASTHQRDLR